MTLCCGRLVNRHTPPFFKEFDIKDREVYFSFLLLCALVHLPKSVGIIFYNGCGVWKFLYLPPFLKNVVVKRKMLVVGGRVTCVEGRSDFSL